MPIVDLATEFQGIVRICVKRRDRLQQMHFLCCRVPKHQFATPDACRDCVIVNDALSGRQVFELVIKAELRDIVAGVRSGSRFDRERIMQMSRRRYHYRCEALQER